MRYLLITMEEHRNSLKPGYRLHWYEIKKILGQGGFGITYLAEDTNLNQEVAIKEFLPVELAVRDQDASIHPLSGEHGEQFSWGLDRFMSEAQTLAKFKHPNIVRVLTVFPENNTAYMVMEYEKGQAMHELLKEKKTLSESELTNILLPILDGLEQVHSAGFIHRDIKPPNIFIRADGSPVLLDFGSARQSLGEKTRTMTSMVSPGFAPFEQYVSKSDKQGPWTDIYGLAATLYRSAVGRSPAEAMDRSEALLHTGRDSFVGAAEISPQGYSKAFLAAIDHGLAFKPEQRPQTIAQWRAELKQEPAEDRFAEAETCQVAPTAANPAAAALNQTTEKITIKVEEPVTENHESTMVEKSKRRYRNPLKVIAAVFGILLLLAILDDDDKEGKGIKPEAGDENVSTKQAGTDDPVNIDNLLDAATTDMEALRLTSPEGNNAYEKYRQVLALEADNAVAHAGMKNVAGEYLKLAHKSLKQREILQASSYVDKAISVYAEHPDIPRLKDAIAKQQVAVPVTDNPVTDALPANTSDMISSSDRKKLERVQRQLSRDPDNIRAKQELRKLGSKYEALVKKAITEKEYDLAESYIEEILVLSPDNKKLREALHAIKAKKASD